MNLNACAHESKAKEAEAASATVTPLRFALKYAPPTLVVEFEQCSAGGGSNKRYLQRISLKRLPSRVDASTVADKLKRRYPKLLCHPCVPDTQVERLVRRLVEHAGSSASCAASAPTAPPSPPPPPSSSSSAVPSSSPAAASTVPTVASPSPPASPPVSVDNRAVDAALASFFSNASRLPGGAASAAAPSLPPLSTPGASTPALAPPPPLPSTSAALSSLSTPPARNDKAAAPSDESDQCVDDGDADDFNDELEALLSATADTDVRPSRAGGFKDTTRLPAAELEGDLQHVDPATLAAAKAEMNLAFEANRKRPGDPGYAYDVEVDFEPGEESNDWDDDDDDE